MAFVRIPPDDLEARKRVREFFISFEAEQKNSVLNHSLTSETTEPISKFSQERCVVVRGHQFSIEVIVQLIAEMMEKSRKTSANLSDRCKYQPLE